MNILIVDDDFISRTKMNTILEEMGTCTMAETGAEAVTTFKAALAGGKPFDLITLDINMPDMDGKEALASIRTIESDNHISDTDKVKVIMVTAHSDKGSLVSCFQSGCDDFVVKPFDVHLLKEKIDKLFPSGPDTISQKEGPPGEPATETEVFENIASALKKGKVSLPSIPDIHTRLKELVQSGAGIDELSELLKQDMMIASELISIANSALVRGVEKTTTVDEALNRMGLDTAVKQVEIICHRAMYSCATKKYSGYLEALWQHATSVASVSQYIADNVEFKPTEDPFMLGLVHDIGKPVLLQIVSALEETGKFGKSIDRKILDATLTIHHPRFGATLLERWGFPEIFLQTTEHHHDAVTITLTGKELAIVSLANVLVKSLDTQSELLIINNKVASAAIMSLGLNSKNVDNLREGIRSILTEQGLPV